MFKESYINNDVRDKQNTEMMYACLMASLTEEARSVIEPWSDEYHVGDTPSGNLLLRVIIRESHLDSNATTSVIRRELTELDDYMALVGSNAGKCTCTS